MRLACVTVSAEIQQNRGDGNAATMTLEQFENPCETDAKTMKKCALADYVIETTPCPTPVPQGRPSFDNIKESFPMREIVAGYGKPPDSTLKAAIRDRRNRRG